MGKGKSKDRIKVDEERPSPSSDVFKAIFGDVPEKSDLCAIFSDANPFKRKIDDVAVRGGVPEGGDGAGGGVKRRKVEEDEGGVVGVASPEVKGSKKGKRKALLAGSVTGEDAEMVEGDGDGDGDGDVVGLTGEDGQRDGPGEDRRGNKKKKRKRDEVETLYEVKKYGEEVNEEAKGSDEKITGKKRKKADDSADAFVPKEEGFDDEFKLLRTVFVGNLPLKMKKKALVKEFSKFGNVESVRIRSVPLLDTKTPRKGAIRQKEVNDAVDRYGTSCAETIFCN